MIFKKISPVKLTYPGILFNRVSNVQPESLAEDDKVKHVVPPLLTSVTGPRI